MAAFLENYNLPILSFIAYAVLTSVPHAYAVHVASGGNPTKHDNANPRSTAYADQLKKKLSPERLATYQRAEACHNNHLENFPIYIAAVLSGYLAEQYLKSLAGGSYSASEASAQIGLSKFVVGWFTLRILYTFNYISTTSQVFSFLRSTLYVAGAVWAFTVIARSARVLA